MKNYLIFLLFILLTFTFHGLSQAKDIYPKNHNIDILHYLFKLELSDEHDQIRGETTITLKYLSDSITTFQLDLVSPKSWDPSVGMKIRKILNEKEEPVLFEHSSDKIRLKFEQDSKPNLLTIIYDGIPEDGLIISKNKYGHRTFFGDNWPNRAHHWLPTIDHPYEKATCEFIITAPQHYQVVATGLKKEESMMTGNKKLTHYENKVPLSTKVMVIGVARFAIQYLGEINSVPIESWVYPQNREEGFYDYAIVVKIFRFFYSHIGPYAFAKLANVQSKTRYGGMENAGNIFYHEGSVTGNRQSEALIAHEVAHQWFGDSASEKDWEHIWLSEGFATYFTHLYFEFSYGRDKMIERMLTDKAKILSYYDTHPHPIVFSGYTDLMEILNTNSYQKASWVLHMLRFVVGDDIFWEGIRKYYQTYNLNNALTKDFQSVMENVSGEDLDWFFKQWFFHPGQPKLQLDWKYHKKDRKAIITIHQTQKDLIYQMPIEIGITSKNEEGNLTETIHKIQLKEGVQTFEISTEHPPRDIIMDPNHWLLFTE